MSRTAEQKHKQRSPGSPEPHCTNISETSYLRLNTAVHTEEESDQSAWGKTLSNTNARATNLWQEIHTQATGPEAYYYLAVLDVFATSAL